MGDVGEAWKVTKDIRKAYSVAKRLKNYEYAINVFKTNNISYLLKNGGYHLIVNHNKMVIDYWPTTGKFSIRGSGIYQRGINKLMKKLSDSASK